MATMTMIDPSGPAPGRPGATPPGELPDRDAVHPEPVAAAVVGLHEHADRRAAATTRDAVPMPPLKPWHCMPVPLPTPPSATGRRSPPAERGVDVLGARRASR